MKRVIRTIIIDDEKLARDLLRTYLQDIEQLEIISECENGFEGLKAVNELKPDLLFLDIQMPKISGFELLELLEDPPMIIFTTAYDEYAIKAFELNAVDYLLKPFPKERVVESVRRAVKLLKQDGSESEKIKKLQNSEKAINSPLSRVVVKINHKITVIPVEGIIYLEAQDDYVQIVTPTGKFLKQKTMNYFEKNLNPERFVRIHRSYIANIDEIKNLES